MFQELEIEVTELDILEGKFCNSSECPVARAARRYFKEGLQIHVGNTINLYMPSVFHPVAKIYLTEEALRFIRRYDDRRHPMPVKFTIMISPEFLKDEYVTKG
jgi:hypothetical protein